VLDETRVLQGLEYEKGVLNGRATSSVIYSEGEFSLEVSDLGSPAGIANAISIVNLTGIV
jgi:hypothetical protein